MLELVPERWREREPTEEDLRQLDLYGRIVQSFVLMLPMIALEYSLHARVLSLRLRGDRARYIAGVVEGVVRAMGMSARASARAERIFSKSLRHHVDDPELRGAEIAIEGFRAYREGTRGRWKIACAKLERLIADERYAGIANRWEVMIWRNVLMFGCYMTGDRARAEELMQLHLSRSRSDLYAYGNSALVQIALFIRGGRIDEAERALIEWEPLVPPEPLTFMRAYFEIGAAALDLARGRMRASLAQSISRWPALCATG
jgi:hypothetical protein